MDSGGCVLLAGTVGCAIKGEEHRTPHRPASWRLTKPARRSNGSTQAAKRLQPWRAVGAAVAVAADPTTSPPIAAAAAARPLPPQVRNVPVWLLKGTRGLLRSFQWATDAADRLAFAEVLSSNESFSADMAETYKLLGVDPASITSLEAYLKVRHMGRAARPAGGKRLTQGRTPAGRQRAQLCSPQGSLPTWATACVASLQFSPEEGAPRTAAPTLGCFLARVATSPGRLALAGVLHRHPEEAQGRGRHLQADQLLHL